MAAKLLQSLADDNPDLQKQIGCMTGIFQLFDRHHVLSARRITHKKLPPDNSHFSNGSLERETNNEIYHQASAAEINLNKNLNDKQRPSTESSRASFSSSCSSSLSSMECNRIQPEASFDRIIFPETPSSDPVMNLSHVSPHSVRQSLDLRDLVKDSMYREGRGLSVKTVKDETGMKHRDSPRPLLLSKFSNGSYTVNIDGKQNLSADLKESLRVFSKLKEAPWCYAEARELPRSSHDVKDGAWHSISKDAPRFSYDGKDIRRLSFESRDAFKATPKLKELPRLSLDSREGSMRNSGTESKMCLLQKSLQSGDYSIERASNVSKSSEPQKRLPGVVAKLMGLETLPDSPMAGDDETDLLEPSAVGDKDPFSSSLRMINPNMSYPSKFTMKDQTSPRQKNSDLVMKPISSSRFPIEPAPWKQQDGNRGYRKAGFRNIKPPTRTPDSFPSVYSEIEKRLKDLEFKKSGRDLRALKQILETMQAKGLLDKEEQGSNFGRHKTYEPCSSSDQNSRLVRQPKSQINSPVTGTVRASDSTRGFESPIVIMKPTKRVDKSGTSASSIVTMDGISDPSNKKVSVNAQTAKDQSPRNIRRDAASAASIHDKKTSTRNIRSTQSPIKSKENSHASVKNSGPVSPRLQQKKFDLERSSRPHTLSSDSGKPRRLSSKLAPESTSPGGKRRPKLLNMQHSDDQLNQISTGLRSLSCHGDDISLLSDAKALLDSKLDAEITSSLQYSEKNVSQSSTIKTKFLISDSMQQNSTTKLDEDRSVKEIAIVTPQPSPVSVLETSIYRDEALSPVKQISHALEDGSNHGTEDNRYGSHWTSEDKTWSNCVGSGLTSEFNRKKLQNVENLVQKLRQLSSSHDEVRTDYIASLCENTNPDHRYISEILLASGLLLRDLSSDLMTFQLHPSGHPINPELFFVLEQTHASTLFPKEECSSGLISRTKSDPEKQHRKLVFDTVNEILSAKLASLTPSSELCLKPNRSTKKIPTAQKLLKELCYEVEQIQAKKSVCDLEDEDDGLKSVLWEDVMHPSDSWIDFHNEIPGIVLDVERLVFKDLVDEVVIGEAAGLRSKPSRRRQLFAN